MKNLKNLNDLLIDQVRNLYDTETQWKNAIEKNMSRVNSPDLKKVMEFSKEKCVENSKKLEKILTKFKKETFIKPNPVAREIINHTNFIVENADNTDVMDAGLIAAHQQMHHYKMANYGTSSTYAKLLKEKEVSDWLHDSIETEKVIDEKLSKVAKDKIYAKPALILETV